MALQLLTEYSSDENASDEEVNKEPTKKLKLPLPKEFNIEKVQEVVDDPSLHYGRKRSYPHERGNWSSLIYVPFAVTETFDIFCDQIIDIFSTDLEVMKISEPHISLSKTFVLYYHWINNFSSSIQLKLSTVSSYGIFFDSIKVYCNENFTRTFIALAVKNFPKELPLSIKIIDECLKEYKLPPFYEDASYHMSFAWCLGNKREMIEKKMIDIQKVFNLYKDPPFSITVNQYNFKTGFKEFKIRLS